MGYIYILTSPNGKSYIGQTSRPIHKRLEEHEIGKSKSSRAIYNAITFHGWENFEKDWYYCPDEELNKHEELMVEVLGTLSPNGYNLKEGGGNGKLSEETKQKIGEGNKGKVVSEESKQKMRKAHIGKTLSEGHKLKISEVQYGKKHTEETKQKIREGNKDKVVSEETKKRIGESKIGEKNPNSKRVYQYNLDGTFISSFGSNGEAARCLDKKEGSSIARCAIGNQGRETAYGFKWSYNPPSELFNI